jgi:hypothetical protein
LLLIVMARPRSAVMNIDDTSSVDLCNQTSAGTNPRGPSMPRAVLVVGHARDRGNCRRLVDPAARVACLARHADFDAIARVLALAIAAPRAIGRLLTDPAGVVAN